MLSQVECLSELRSVAVPTMIYCVRRNYHHLTCWPWKRNLLRWCSKCYCNSTEQRQSETDLLSLMRQYLRRKSHFPDAAAKALLQKVVRRGISPLVFEQEEHIVWKEVTERVNTVANTQRMCSRWGNSLIIYSSMPRCTFSRDVKYAYQRLSSHSLVHVGYTHELWSTEGKRGSKTKTSKWTLSIVRR